MKKISKWFIGLFASLFLFILVACSNVSQSYANKINKAAESGEYMTYTEVKEDLGDDCIDLTVLKSGVIISVKGVSSKDDLKEKLDDEEDVEGIIVTFVTGKAMSATYRKITSEDLK